MNNTNFTICKANQEQRDYVFERVTIKDEQERKNAVVYVATDSGNQIIGRTVIKEKDVPAPISGKYWYIENLFVHPEYRRKGIASALIAEIKRQAEILEIVYLYGSANASVEASLFWLNQGFTMNAYGKRQEDSSKPLFFGNYFHYINYCIRRKSLVADTPLCNIKKASPEEVQQVIDKFVDCYLHGRTPNPCIDCNRYLKFDELKRRAEELGCDTIVTSCPLCNKAIARATTSKVEDIAEIIAKNITASK